LNANALRVDELRVTGSARDGRAALVARLALVAFEIGDEFANALTKNACHFFQWFELLLSDKLAIKTAIKLGANFTYGAFSDGQEVDEKVVVVPLEAFSNVRHDRNRRLSDLTTQVWVLVENLPTRYRVDLLVQDTGILPSIQVLELLDGSHCSGGSGSATRNT